MLLFLFNHLYPPHDMITAQWVEPDEDEETTATEETDQDDPISQ